MSETLNETSKFYNYDIISSSLSLNKLRDLYAAYYVDLIFKDYENIVSPEQLEKIFGYKKWIVIGPLIERNVISYVNSNIDEYGVSVADSALARAIRYDLKKIDIYVTDFDGLDPLYEMAEVVSKKSELISVHLHGDNIESAWKVARVLRMYKKSVIPTIQVGKAKKAYKIGGFTDGDRAVLLSYISGARTIVLAGMDFFASPLPNGLRTTNDIRSRYKLKIADNIIQRLIEDKMVQIEKWR